MEGDGGQGAEVRAGEIQPLQFVPATDSTPLAHLDLGELGHQGGQVIYSLWAAHSHVRGAGEVAAVAGAGRGGSWEQGGGWQRCWP